MALTAFLALWLFVGAYGCVRNFKFSESIDLKVTELWWSRLGNCKLLSKTDAFLSMDGFRVLVYVDVHVTNHYVNDTITVVFPLVDSNYSIKVQVEEFCSIEVVGVELCLNIYFTILKDYESAVQSGTIEDVLHEFTPPAAVSVQVVGDSFSRWPWSVLADATPVYSVDLRVRWIGPRLMNSFAREGLQILQRLDPPFGPQDVIVLVFGAPDVYAHLARFVRQYGLLTAIHGLADRYVATIVSCRAVYPETNTFVVAGLPPPANLTKYVDTFQYSNVVNTTGSDLLLFTLLLNQRLEYQCRNHNLHFMDFYHDYANPVDGFLLANVSLLINHLLVYLPSTQQQMKRILDDHFAKLPVSAVEVAMDATAVSIG